MRLILASNSATRAKILREFGIEFSQLFNIQFDLIEVDKIETEQ